VDPRIAGKVRSGSRRRPGPRHGAATDERRVRVRHPRSDRSGRQGWHRLVGRFRRRRGLREFRRRAVRAGRQRRALSRGSQARGGACRHRRGAAGVLHRRGEDRTRAVGAQPDQRAVRRQRIPRRFGRGRTSVRPGPVWQGVLRRVVLQAPRRVARSLGDAARPGGERRHHRAIRRSHLGGGQSPQSRVSRARDHRGLEEAAGADRGRPGVARTRACRMRRALQVADNVAELVLRPRRSRGGRRRRREPAGLRRHDAQGRPDASLRVPARAARRPRPRRALARRHRSNTRLPDVHQRQPVSRCHAGDRLAQPAGGRAGGAHRAAGRARRRRGRPLPPARPPAAAAPGQSCRRNRCEPRSRPKPRRR
jgi:hypothetical protein